MERRQSKKRFASASRTSSPHLKQQRLRVESSSSVSFSLLNDSSSRSSADEVDSGLETFISDCHSSADDATFDLAAEWSPELAFPLRTNEKLGVDSPIIKHMEKMSVISRAVTVSAKPNPSAKKCHPNSSGASVFSNVLQVCKGKRSENFVLGQSLIRGESRDNDDCDKPEVRCIEFRIKPRFLAEPHEVPASDPSDDKENWPGYQRSTLIFEQHPEIEEDMRSILLAWMMEVSKAYCLRRKTYHMALDFVDRFLSMTENLPKGLLQLVGVATLSLAAKIEEIFPPELKEMAYVTAEAHSKTEIKSMEKIILAVLGTAFMPVTPSDCVGFYLKKAGLTQTTSGRLKLEPLEDTRIARENWLPLKLYSKICRVIDLSLLDAESLRFSYRQIAAAAVHLVGGTSASAEQIIDLSEFDSVKCRDCVEWMERFADAEHMMAEVSESNPCEDARHNHHQIMWPHLQLYNFSLEEFMAIMETKKEAASVANDRRNEENSGEGNKLVEEMIDRLLDDDALFCGPAVMSPSRLTGKLTAGSPAPPSSMFLTPPDSRRPSCASVNSRSRPASQNALYGGSSS